jgi:glycosyltransferase involved in cell wall biosynthesis
MMNAAAPKVQSDRPLRVCFVFASGGIGGAERSMARMMAQTHPERLGCSLVLSGTANPEFVKAVEPLGVPCRHVGKLAVRQMTRVFRELAPDVVYMFGRGRTLAWALAARRAGVPAIVGAECSAATQLTDRISRRLDRHLIDGYITNSAFAANSLASVGGVNPEKIHVAHYGVAFQEDTAPPPELGENFGHPSVICVANLRPLKGHKLLLRVIKQLQPQFPELRAVLVGSDVTNGQFFREIDNEGLNDTFTWLGFQPRVRPLLRQADIFVLPTLTREGMPNSMFEAMYEKLPVIGTNVGGVSELVDHGRTGLVVPPRDPDALREALLTLLRSPELRQSYGLAGRARMDEEFTMERMVEKHLDAFHAILQRVGPSRSAP